VDTIRAQAEEPVMNFEHERGNVALARTRHRDHLATGSSS
jgi:hypothetical protein